MAPFSSAPTREPIFNLPVVVLAGILVMLGIHAVRTLFLPDVTDLTIVIDWAVVPVRWTAAYGGVPTEEILSRINGSPATEPSFQAELARYVLDEGEGRPWTAVSYAFLHGSWAHVILNSIWLAAFGTPVARRCGAPRFILLSAATAAGGAVGYAVMHPFQALPLVGASAAVSGMMAAAAWFVFSVPRHEDGRYAEPHERLRETLASLARNRQVLIFLSVWLIANYVSAVVAQPLGLTDASIAWEAHVGGFIVGLMLFPLLDPLRARGSA
jgi:membrane associated rhomboid family serine protease